MPDIGPSRRSRVAAWGTAALAGAGLFWAASPRGIGLLVDSAVYVSAAENLEAGRGYRSAMPRWDSDVDTAPVVHLPPLYSAVLAAAPGPRRTPRACWRRCCSR